MQIVSVLIGPLCLVLGVFFALYVKDKAREIAKEEVISGMKSALAIFKNELIETLDTTYTRSKELDLMLKSRDERFENIEDRLDVHAKAIAELEKVSERHISKLTDLERRICDIEVFLKGYSRHAGSKT